MKYTIILEKGSTSWGAYVPDLPGCMAVAETKTEVKVIIKEAIEFHPESYKIDKKRIPKIKTKSYEMKVMV